MKLKILFLMIFLSGEILFGGLGQPATHIKEDSLMDINMESNMVSISPQYGKVMIDGGDYGTNLNRYILPKIKYGAIVLNHQNRKLSLAFGHKKTYLVLVALNEYKNKGIHSLKFSISGAKKFSNKIKNSAKSMVEYRLFDSQATKENIIDQFKKALKNANKNDDIIFYWSGLGVGKLGNKYMIPYNFSRYDNPKYKAIVITELEELAKKSGQSVILLFDGMFDMATLKHTKFK